MAALTRSLFRASQCIAQVRTFTVSAASRLGDEGNVDKVTHTGQVWDKNDYRRVRFVGKDKMVNEEWAINLIAEDPVVVCEARKVWSNSGGPLGHPKVFINLDRPDVEVCGYSGRKFIQKKYYDPAKHGPSITYEEYMKQLKEYATQ